MPFTLPVSDIAPSGCPAASTELLPKLPAMVIRPPPDPVLDFSPFAELISMKLPTKTLPFPFPSESDQRIMSPLLVWKVE